LTCFSCAGCASADFSEIMPKAFMPSRTVSGPVVVNPVMDADLKLAQLKEQNHEMQVELDQFRSQIEARAPQASDTTSLKFGFGILGVGVAGVFLYSMINKLVSERRSRHAMNAGLLNDAELARVPTRAGEPVMIKGGGTYGVKFDPNKVLNKYETYGRTTEKLQAGEEERKKIAAEEEAKRNAAKYKKEELKRKMERMSSIPDEKPVGRVKDFMYKQGVQDILDKLDYDLIGLQVVKQRIRDMASLLIIDKMRLKLGFETAVPSLHMTFTGNPGTGKTTVALRMGQILQRMGYCRSGHVVLATRDDLVGQYVGHTGPKTKEMIKKAMGGILFIDEAYYLYNAANPKDYGVESVEILLTVMEKNRDDLIVVFAGYKDKMDAFYSYTPGLQSRVGNDIDFPDYDEAEMLEIAKVMCRDTGYTMEAGAEEAFKYYISKRKLMPFFSNARTVRNAVDLSKMKSANRIYTKHMRAEDDGMVDVNELTILKAEDIPDPDELDPNGINA